MIQLLRFYPHCMPTVTFIYGDQVKKVQTEGGKTILQIALDNDVPMEYACGGNGFCTTCLCKIKEGGQNLSEINDREENMGFDSLTERLGCQAEVKGDVTVELMDI